MAELANVAGQDGCDAWLAAHADLLTSENVDAVHAVVLHMAYADHEQAAKLSLAASVLAGRMGDRYSRAMALRCSGHVHFARAEYAPAVADYSSAVELLESSGRDLEIGRTLTSALQALIYLNDYDRAFAWAARARDIFARYGDELRLARLTSNMGNILYRQERHAAALRLYDEALEAFNRIGEPRDVAAVLSNIAVCCTRLGQFPRALDCYRRARSHSESNGLPLLVAAADYNIAYLHYLRGDYKQAMELYAKTRTHCEQVGDSYHAALCDLDESGMYLELNLSDEGGELAKRAAGRFDELGMAYERAKALVNQAVAQSHQGDPQAASNLFQAARELFVEQKNPIWPALIDLDQAILARRNGDAERSQELCRKAYRVLSGSLLPGKATLCELLEAQLLLDRGLLDAARSTCLTAMERVDSSDAAAQRFQGHFVMAQIQEAQGEQAEALESYRRAVAEIEGLRNRLWGENSRISFLKNKLDVYEGLVWLELDSGQVERAFLSIEHAKSRSMVEMLSFPELLTPSIELQEMRRDLNWHYRQIEIAAVSQEDGVKARIAEWQQRSREIESDIGLRLTAMRPQERGLLGDSTRIMPFEELQASIPEGATLVEYYEVRGVFFACLLTRKGLRLIPVARTGETRAVLRLLQFQLSKLRLGREYVTRFEAIWDAATNSHLRHLYDLLVAPLRENLNGSRQLIVVPHSFLHSLPFHALHDGERYLVDSFAISYSPSASVYALCDARPRTFTEQSLVLGVPDAQAPEIEAESRAAASVLPGARLFLGAAATESALRGWGPSSRFLHIATHGMFRRDNPLFSSIRLGDSHLNLVDLYQIPLAAELVTLSGCSTGLNTVVGGDELLGLMRGLLHAGAHSMLVSLWDVNDASTTAFMKEFYVQMGQAVDKGEALQRTMIEMRKLYPHPYFWAPFVLVGKRYRSS